MATITNFNVTINKMCRADQTSCALAYTYNVLWDNNDPVNKDDFTVKALLWGGTSYNHNHFLVDSTDDSHKINRDTPMPVTRMIDVRCDMLDRFWGYNITMKLVITPDSGEDITYEAISTTEMEKEMMATREVEEAA